MPTDDFLWQMFADYVYVTIGQAMQILADHKPTIHWLRRRLPRMVEVGWLGRQRKNDFSDYVYYLAEAGGRIAYDRGFLAVPRYIEKKSPMTLDHDTTITDFHIRLKQALPNLVWKQWRGELAAEFDDIPDALFSVNGEDPAPFEYVRSSESDYKNGESSLVTKLKAYAKAFKRSYVVMPTERRIEVFLMKIEQELPTSKLWFTSEDAYRKDIAGKIWWTPKNFRERQYSILPPEQ